MSIALGVAVAINFANNFLEGVKQSNETAKKGTYYSNQANLYRQNAARVRLNGAMSEDISRAKNRADLSRSSTAVGEAGMGESPTFLSLLATTSGVLEQNVLNNRYAIESEAENYLYQSRVAEENARVMKKKSANAFQNGLMNGISSSFNLLSSEQ